LKPPFLAHDVGCHASRGEVWVTSGDAHEVAVYDLLGNLRRRLPAGSAPQHVTFAGGIAYVTSGNDGTFRVVRNGRELATTRVPRGSYKVQSGRGLVLTPSLETGSLTVLARSGRRLHEVQVARSSHDACFLA